MVLYESIPTVKYVKRIVRESSPILVVRRLVYYLFEAPTDFFVLGRSIIIIKVTILWAYGMYTQVQKTPKLYIC